MSATMEIPATKPINRAEYQRQWRKANPEKLGKYKSLALVRLKAINQTIEKPADKQCTKCGELKPANLFSRTSFRKDGRRNECKSCCAAYDKKWRASNPEKVKEKQRRFDERHHEKENARKAKWLNENKEWKKQWTKTYSIQNKSQLIEKRKSLYYKDIELSRKKSRVSAREYRLRNPEKVKCRLAKWKAKNPSYYRDYRARQKAIRQFFQMHIAMRAIAETLNQMKP